MRSSSRDSLAACRGRLNEAVRSGSVSPDQAAALADDLDGVARLLVRQPALRRALSDPASRPERRSALARDLFGGKVSEPAADLLVAAVESRWSTGAELLDGIELLAVDALLAGAEQEDTLTDVEDELFRFTRVVAGQPDLARALGDTTAAPERRVELANGLLAGKAHPATARLAAIAIRGLGGRKFEPSIERLLELAAARRDRQVAYVRVASPLTSDQEERLAARLAEMYGRRVSLRIDVDPTVLGGVAVRLGDEELDGTVARRLRETRSALVRR
jgi:F-type H+-transporting ATPase subunit delta